MSTATCEWFALCDHEAYATVRHPILGDVPCCGRCAAKLGLTLEPTAEHYAEVVRVGFAGTRGTYWQPPEPAELVIHCPVSDTDCDAVGFEHDIDRAECAGDATHGRHTVLLPDPGEG